MKLTIDEKEYTVKSLQAIEILDLVEKSGLFEKAKTLNSESFKLDNLSEIMKTIPLGYKVAAQVIGLVTGEVKDGVCIPNMNIAHEMEAMRLPLLALQIVQGLMYPIQYVVTSDPSLEEEKKSDSEGSVETSPGKKD